jgi:tRNA pseudouridine55 synthase
MGRKTKDSGLDGLLIIDKPAGMTSTDVVSRVRRITGQRRCGHSGTLDPGATGVLLVALGQCTKLLQYLSTHTKSYTAELVLGSTTTTLDNEGDVIATFDMSGVTLAQVKEAAAALTGDIMQIPPMVSAIQINGKRLHEYAREGIEVERSARPVYVSRYDVAPTNDPLVFRIDVACSTGTYVRVLAADVGEALGGGAHLRFLRRTSIGPFDEANAVALDESLADVEPMTGPEMLAHLPVGQVDADVQAKVLLGSVFDRAMFSDIPADAPLWRVQHGTRLLGLYEPFRLTQCKPALILGRDP